MLLPYCFRIVILKVKFSKIYQCYNYLCNHDCNYLFLHCENETNEIKWMYQTNETNGCTDFTKEKKGKLTSQIGYDNMQ